MNICLLNLQALSVTYPILTIVTRSANITLSHYQSLIYLKYNMKKVSLPESPNTKSGMEQLSRRYWYLFAELDERIANVVFNIIRTPFVVRLAFLVEEIEYDQGDAI